MKLKTILVLGTAGTAVYLFIKKQGKQSAQSTGNQATDVLEQTVNSVPATLGQKLKRGVSGRRKGGRRGTLAGTPQSVRDDTSAVNDLALARQVEATLALNPHFTKDRVLVNADAGRITLRGTTDIGEHIMEFEQTARAVPGVEDVQNLLHIQGTTAPTSHRGGLAKEAVDRSFVATDH